LLSDGSAGAERSFLYRRPARTLVVSEARDGVEALRAFLAEATGQVLALAAYEFGADLEGLDLGDRGQDHPAKQEDGGGRCTNLDRSGLNRSRKPGEPVDR